MPNRSPNPFATTLSRPTPSLKGDCSPLKQANIWLWAGIVITVLLILYGFAVQHQMLPGNRLLALLIPSDGEEQVYAPGVGLNRQDARERYRQSYAALKRKDYQQALDGFKQLEAVYPGLSDVIFLHEATAYAEQGNEWAAQKKLQAILTERPHSPLQALAAYQLGLSHFRGSEWEKAQKQLETVRLKHPKTEYATGSLYYLGQMALNQDKKPEIAIPFWKAYLEACPDCRFSADIAEQLDPLLTTPTPQEHWLLGQGYGAGQRQWDKALHHLSAAPAKDAWLLLAKAQIETRQAPEAVQTLVRGLHVAKNQEDAQEALDLIARHTTSATPTFKALTGQALPFGKDYLLWQLAQRDTANAPGYYQQIVNQFPQSDYAPESSWQLLWPLLKSGQTQSFLSRAKVHMERFHYARSAAKVLFWMGKVQERSNPGQAVQSYQQILKSYPDGYYAFRAGGRLNAVARHQADPGWKTDTTRQNYPPAPLGATQAQLNILPPASQLGKPGHSGKLFYGTLKELQAMGMAEDLTLLLKEATGELPPAVESWSHHLLGDPAKALRTMRDALETRQREGLRQHGLHASPNKLQPTNDELQLLYPAYFGRTIAKETKRQGLDPYLVQSLMREESYFNEFAVSSSDARGLMQLLPSTAQEVAQWEALPGFQAMDLFQPDVNIQLGSRYLGYLHRQFNGNSMPSVGAYNGGPNAMKRWIGQSPYFQSDPDMFVEMIPYEQSRDYIKKVYTGFWNYTRLYATAEAIKH